MPPKLSQQKRSFAKSEVRTGGACHIEKGSPATCNEVKRHCPTTLTPNSWESAAELLKQLFEPLSMGMALQVLSKTVHCKTPLESNVEPMYENKYLEVRCNIEVQSSSGHNKGNVSTCAKGACTDKNPHM